MTAHADSFADDSVLDAALIVDSLCTRFEQAWRAGHQPQIESFLEESDPSLRPAALIELIALEIELSRDIGTTLSLDAYRARFPDFSVAVEKGWALAERVLRDKPPLPLTA